MTDRGYKIVGDSSIDVKVGDTFDFEDGCATQLRAHVSFSDQLFELVESVIVDQNAGGIPLAGGSKDRYAFRALVPGNHEIEFQAIDRNDNSVAYANLYRVNVSDNN